MRTEDRDALLIAEGEVYRSFKAWRDAGSQLKAAIVLGSPDMSVEYQRYKESVQLLQEKLAWTADRLEVLAAPPSHK